MVCVSALWCLSQHLPSYLGFSYLGLGVSLHSCSSKVQPLLLTLDEEYLLTAAPPDLEHGVILLGPPAPAQPLLLGCGVAPLSHRPWPSLLKKKKKKERKKERKCHICIFVIYIYIYIVTNLCWILCNPTDSFIFLGDKYMHTYVNIHPLFFSTFS